MTGAGLVLGNNGKDAVTVPKDGTYKFDTKLKSGDKYDVTVLAQPISPAQNCVPGHATGTIASADVSDVTLNCAASSAEKSAAFPSSGSTLGPGDRLIAQECIPEFTLPQSSSIKYEMPPKDSNYTTTFWVDTHPDATGNVAGHFVQAKTSSVLTLWHLFGLFDKTLPDSDPHHTPSPCSPPGTVHGPVDAKRQYFVNANTLDSYATQMAGAVYGALTIPYKYHFSGGSIAAAPTVAAFVGAHVANPGVDVAMIVAGGLGSVTVPTTTATGQASSDLKTSISLAIGPVITLSKGQKFQIGLLMGSDWTGKSAPVYQYNGKLWAALSLGVALTN
jgi:hypothetical protein